MKKKSNFIMHHAKLTQGFTLIELLVVVSVVIIVGLILLSVIISTLRGTSKATVLSDVKQNGDYALSQMVRSIRSASSLDIAPCGNPSSSVQTITVTQIDTTKSIFDCSGTTITSNGVSLLDTNAVKLVPSTCSIVCSQQNAADTPVLQIQFSLQQNSTSSLQENTASIPFQTSVTMRNLQQ